VTRCVDVLGEPFPTPPVMCALILYAFETLSYFVSSMMGLTDSGTFGGVLGAFVIQGYDFDRRTHLIAVGGN
jgi:hypothetical protein